jgi:signal transduction histidine kinase
MKFGNLNLSAKQIVAFGLVVAIMATANILSLNRMAVLKTEIDEVSTNWLRRAVAISDVKLYTSHLRMSQLQSAFTIEEDKRQVQSETMIALIDRINGNLDIYGELRASSEQRGLYSQREQALYEEFDRGWEQYQELSINFFKLLRNGESDQAFAVLDGEAKTVFYDFSSDLEELVEINKNDALGAAQSAEQTYKDTRNASIIFLVVTSLLSIIIAMALVRLVVVPVRQLESAAREIAEGDLDVRLGIEREDEVGNLAHSFNKMTVALKGARERTEKQAQKLQEQNTDLENAMAQLKTTQEQLLMKEKMASLGQLVAGVSHEINSPLGAVNSAVDVSKRCVDKLEKTLAECASIEDLKNAKSVPNALGILKDSLGVMNAAGERIQGIGKSLKSFARLDEAEYQVVDVVEGIDSTLTLLESEFGDRITVRKEYEETPGFCCYAGELNQAFFNILKNASEAIEGSGTIRIKTHTEDDCVCIEISDTGRGIPPEMLKTIFDFGFTAGSTRIKMASGLSVVYNVVRKHEGEVKIDSEVGRGTSVSIILPTKTGGGLEQTL